MAEVAVQPVPPVPQLAPPLVYLHGNKQGIDLTKLRFDNAWMQWFVQVKIKVDLINASLKNVGQLAGAGFSVKDSSGNWQVRSIQGTTNRISITNGDGQGGNPTINIDPAYAGQNTIVTLGTVTTGVWNGTTIAVANGGTGATDAANARANLGAAPAMVTTSTSATGGSATALPAQPVGYVEVQVNGVTKKMPYYDL